MTSCSLHRAINPLKTAKRHLAPTHVFRSNRLTSRQNQVGETATTPRKPNAVEAALFGKSKVAAKVINPRVIFPWRHEEYPLPRLIPGSDEYELQGGEFGPSMPLVPLKSAVTCFAGSFLGVPWYKVAFPGWKHELADSTSWAFSQAVAGVMTNLYRVPFDDIRTGGEGDFAVDLKHTINVANGGNKVEEDESFSGLDDMLEERLRTLYESAHDCGRDQLQIHLQMRPTSAHLVSIFLVPYLTREQVKQDSSLQDTFRNMYLRLQEEEERRGRAVSMVEIATFVKNEVLQLARDQVELHDDYASLPMTAIAQVVINCDEVFSVTELTTGHVLQGHEDGKIRQIPHLVRLEAVIEMKKDYGSRHQVTDVGPWQITDWDDLLEGNIWFV